MGSAWLGAVAGAAIRLLGASPALGQLTYDYAAPVTVAKESTWVEWVIGAIFILGCLVVAFKGAKRSKLE
jgi:amino acid transporter